MQTIRTATYIKIITSIVLIYLGLNKLLNLETFEYRIIENNIANWTLSAIIIRIIIFIEFFLAIVLLTSINLKKTIFTTTIFLFIFYSLDIFLSYFNVLEISKSYPLTHSNYLLIQTLILSLLFSSILISYKTKSKDLKQKWIKFVIPIPLLILVFSIAPIYIDDYIKYDSVVEQPKLDWNIIEKHTGYSLSNNNILIFFFSTNCRYCNKMAVQLGINNRVNKPKKNMLIVLPSNKKNATAFMNRNKCNIPYIRVSKKEFLSLAGNKFPAIYMVKNKIETNKWSGRTFNLRLIDELIGS